LQEKGQIILDNPQWYGGGCRNGMAGKPQYGGGEGRNGIAQQPPLGFASTLLVWRNGPIGLSEQPRLMQWDAAIPIGAEKFCV